MLATGPPDDPVGALWELNDVLAQTQSHPYLSRLRNQRVRLCGRLTTFAVFRGGAALCAPSLREGVSV
jgi:hypothetical protein